MLSNTLHFLTVPVPLALMELMSAESWSRFLLALVSVMALATLAGIALAVKLEDLGRPPWHRHLPNGPGASVLSEDGPRTGRPADSHDDRL